MELSLTLFVDAFVTFAWSGGRGYWARFEADFNQEVKPQGGKEIVVIKV
jgi:hypothetical protein